MPDAAAEMPDPFDGSNLTAEEFERIFEVARRATYQFSKQKHFTHQMALLTINWMLVELIDPLTPTAQHFVMDMFSKTIHGFIDHQANTVKH